LLAPLVTALLVLGPAWPEALTIAALARSATHARHQPNKHQPECQHRAPHG